MDLEKAFYGEQAEAILELQLHRLTHSRSTKFRRNRRDSTALANTRAFWIGKEAASVIVKELEEVEALRRCAAHESKTKPQKSCWKIDRR